MVDFSKVLWDKHRIAYGPKESYCDYPRRYKTRGVRTCCFTGAKEIVILEISVCTNSEGERWLHIDKGSVTGFESVRLNVLEANPNDWLACAGTAKRWDTLVVKGKDIKQLLKEIL